MNLRILPFIEIKEKLTNLQNGCPSLKKKHLNYYITLPLNMIIRAQKKERQKCSILNKSTITNKKQETWTWTTQQYNFSIIPKHDET